MRNGAALKKPLLSILIVIGLVVFGVFLWWVARASGGRTLWDWVDLLLTPVAVAAAGWWFIRAQRKHQSKIAHQQQRFDRLLERDRQRQEALEQYQGRMTELLVERGLGQPEPAVHNGEVARLARTLTLNALRDLDSRRNRLVVKFLGESKLLGKNDVVTLKKADLAGVQLEGADLARANLARADMQKINLRAANLTEANLEAAELTDGVLEEAKLAGASLYRAVLEKALLRRADLSITDMSGAKLQEVNLEGAKLERANLEGADISGGRLKKANCKRANLSSANLENVDLTDADLEGAVITGANMVGTKLKGAIMRAVDLTGSNLRRGNLWGVNLTRANLSRAILIRSDLRRAKLYGANLRNADLEEADLEEANIRGVEMRGANLRGANLTGVRNWKKEQFFEARCSPSTIMPDGSMHKNWIKRYDLETDSDIPVLWVHRPMVADQESVTKIK